MIVSLLLTDVEFDKLMEYLDDYAFTCQNEYSATDTESEVIEFMDKLNRIKTEIKIE